MQDSTTGCVSFGQHEYCGHCGAWHQGTCPRIKTIEYFQNGTVKRVEYHGEPPARPQEPQQVVSIRQNGHITVSVPNEWESQYASCSDLLGHMPEVN